MRLALTTLIITAGLAVGCSHDGMADKSSPSGGGNALDVDTPAHTVQSSSDTGQPGGMAGGVGKDTVVGSAGGVGPKNAAGTADPTGRTLTTAPAGEMP
ncbi:MAG: hypothetical protein QM754_14780 [Tepidisphaeraceae bacterium]